MKDTQAEAYEHIKPKIRPIKKRIFSALLMKPMTSNEVAEYLDISLLSVRPRLSELLKQGEIFDTNKRRRNASGSNEIVWQLTDTQFMTGEYYYE